MKRGNQQHKRLDVPKRSVERREAFCWSVLKTYLKLNGTSESFETKKIFQEASSVVIQLCFHLCIILCIIFLLLFQSLCVATFGSPLFGSFNYRAAGKFILPFGTASFCILNLIDTSAQPTAPPAARPCPPRKSLNSSEQIRS